MSGYISSNANRFYVALEQSYGRAAEITSSSRFPAVRVQGHQSIERVVRFDKTGTRSHLADSNLLRRVTAFEVNTYLTSWNGLPKPAYGPLFEAALGGPAVLSPPLTVQSTNGSRQIQTSTPHGLSIGSGVCYANQIRFVNAVADPVTFSVNAPFRENPAAGRILAPTATYTLADRLPSLSIYDYWDPITAVSRMIVGGSVNTMRISINGDLHEFSFDGVASDLLDSCSFVAGSGGLETYPAEPAVQSFDYSVVPGHLGEACLGSTDSEFFTLTEASIEIKNNIETRNHEYGSVIPRASVAGPREVLSHFALLAQDDAQTIALYAASKSRTPISAMLQLGQQQGRLMGVFFPSIVPEIPLYDDSKPRLQWEFNNNVAYGTSNDEIFVAFA